jgi:hypothetical protein
MVKCCRTRMVPEEFCYKVPYTTCRMVPEEIVKYVPHTTCTLVPECRTYTIQKKVPVCVPCCPEPCGPCSALPAASDWKSQLLVRQSHIACAYKGD